MASVFKRSRDKGRRRSSWYISYDDEYGKRKTKKGFTDKRATEDLALELEQDVKRRKEGLVDPREKKRQEAGAAPIEYHVAAFKKSISKNSPKHVSITLSRLQRMIAEAEIQTLGEIDIESLEAVLTDMLDADEIGHRTYNHYAQAMHQFCNWLVPTRMASNPLIGMKRLNTDVDIRRPRRALKPEEFKKLLKSARQSDVVIQTFDGEQRARIYSISFLTGLRKKEIASLTPTNFELESDLPKVTVDASCSKHRRKDVLPLHPELVALLKDWFADLESTEFLFPDLAKRRTALMVKKDLERVGIPYRNEEGFADFHASGRHTHITELLRNGASLPEARELARHSDIRMTMKYTHIGIEDQARAVSKLPSLSGVDENTDNEGELAAQNGQRYDSGHRRLKGQSRSSSGTESATANPVKKNVRPRVNADIDTEIRGVAPRGRNSAKVEAAGRQIDKKTSLLIPCLIGTYAIRTILRFGI